MGLTNGHADATQGLAQGLAQGMAQGMAEGSSSLHGSLQGQRLPWLSGLGRGMTTLNSADHVEMCRQAVAAAAAAVGKPGGGGGGGGGGGSGLPAAPPRPGGLPMLHSMLVRKESGYQPDLLHSFNASLNQMNSAFGGGAGASAGYHPGMAGPPRRSSSLDSEDNEVRMLPRNPPHPLTLALTLTLTLTLTPTLTPPLTPTPSRYRA